MAKVAEVWSQVWRVLTGTQLAGRGVTVFPDDVFLVSYPRSGNTWTRFLISNLLHTDEPTSFANVESRVPEIYFNPDRVLRRLARPRLLKSHECFQPHYPRVIYLVRDPRDVAVSFYHHNVKAGNIPDHYPMEEFVPRFMKAEFDTKWGTWSDHVLSWRCLREGRREFLLLRYETLKDNPAGELARVSEFLSACNFPGMDISPDRLRRAIELSSPERMRQMEREQAAKWVLTKTTRQDKPFVRSATSGAWKSSLPGISAAAIEARWGSLMKELGYDLSGGLAFTTVSETVRTAH